MPRAVPEWIGRTPDTQVPPRVQLRVLEAHNHICHISGIKIRSGDNFECDHKVALINGGENRERNLAPALTKYHKQKTKEDVAEKAVIYRKKKTNYGIKKIQSRPMIGTFASGVRIRFNGDVERR